MGVDEAILHAVADGRSPPTLRFYRWSPPCVTIGYFQSMEAEVDLEACRAAGVGAIRRLTGGGAVFHDAEVTYSVVVPEGGPLSPPDILESYRRICAGLVEGLAELGIEAAFSPINDIAVGGKKVSGNAQTRKSGCLLQHGTVLMAVDLERMFSVLKVPSEKLKGKLIEGAKARVTSLGAILGREVAYEETVRALVAGFSRAWGRSPSLPEGIVLAPGELSDRESEEARGLAAGRFSDPAWNMKR
ncbi:MAG: lipoate--protein ligase family protein [Spirochaetaceae bacterium]|nr:lipoate--protein ligase family protein [Spirochaetaceae bacterium]